MTGEVTLRGHVLPIGGLKEKTLAALRHGITTLIVPHRNHKDLDEVPKELRKKCKFILAKDVHEVLKNALVNDPAEWSKQLKANDSSHSSAGSSGVSASSGTSASSGSSAGPAFAWPPSTPLSSRPPPGLRPCAAPAI